MTSGERMVWAATYVAASAEGFVHAAQEAAYAVWKLRRGGSGDLDGDLDGDAKAMLDDMLSNGRDR